MVDSVTRICEEQRPAFEGLREEALIDRIAGSVVARLGNSPKAEGHSESRYVRDKEAASFLGVSAHTLRAWRSRGKPSGPTVTRMGRMVMYSVKELEQFMKQRTVERRQRVQTSVPE